MIYPRLSARSLRALSSAPPAEGFKGAVCAVPSNASLGNGRLLPLSASAHFPPPCGSSTPSEALGMLAEGYLYTYTYCVGPRLLRSYSKASGKKEGFDGGWTHLKRVLHTDLCQLKSGAKMRRVGQSCSVSARFQVGRRAAALPAPSSDLLSHRPRSPRAAVPAVLTCAAAGGTSGHGENLLRSVSPDLTGRISAVCLFFQVITCSKLLSSLAGPLARICNSYAGMNKRFCSLTTRTCSRSEPAAEASCLPQPVITP